MAIIPDRKRVVEYVPLCDRESDDKTVFKLRPISKRAEQAIVENPDDGWGAIHNTLKDSLVGWDNLKTEDGATVAFDSDADIAEILPLELRRELYDHAVELSTLKARDAKN